MSILLDFLNARQHSTLKPQNPEYKADVSQRFIVGGSHLSPAKVPEGVQLTPRKIVGPRVVVKGHRYFENFRGVIARWPESGLEEWTHHKLVYVLAGRLQFQLGHYAIQCGKGYCLVLPPGIPQPDASQMYDGVDQFCEYLNVILHPHAVQCFISQAQNGHVILCRENYLFQNNRLAVLFRLLMDELIKEEKYSSHIGEDLLAAFWTMLLHETELGRYVTPGPEGRPRTALAENEGFEASLLHYIQTHLNQNLTLERVAQDLYLSRTQFVRQMRRETGKTFVQYLTEYRLGEAKTLLEDSNWTVSAIAGFLGFKSPTYFQTVFRRATGQTPSQYRAEKRRKV
jgi:AraC-like DNA-binding protein